MANQRILFVFLDGIGLGPANGSNPVAAARLPTLEALLGGRKPVWEGGSGPGRGGVASSAGGAVAAGPDATLVGIDATHGHPGTPQSGTGHTTLLTGVDAVERFGRPYGPWIPTALRPLVAEQSVLALARAEGRRVAFANAYPEELVGRVPADIRVAEAVRSRRLGPLRSGPPLAALGAGVLDRHTPALERGRAVASEITNEGWIRRLGRSSLPDITPEEAGRNLARIAGDHDLTLFAHYTLDYVGHRGEWAEAVAAVERVDAFLGGVMGALPSDVLLLVASDHGNVEDATRQHTRNPALGLVAGRGHEAVAGAIRTLAEVPAAILGALEVRPRVD